MPSNGDQDAPSFVAWVKDPTIPFFPPVTFNVTLNLERTDDGYLMRWDIACVRTDEPDAWVAMYRVVMNAADEGGKGILRHLARTDVLLFSLMSGKDHLEIHTNYGNTLSQCISWDEGGKHVSK
jgi:hypothetical protein